MTTKKIKVIKAQSDKQETELAPIDDVVVAKKKELLNSGKSIQEIIKERGIRPIKDDTDFKRIFGEYKEWFDVDKFLKETHRPWKQHGNSNQ